MYPTHLSPVEIRVIFISLYRKADIPVTLIISFKLWIIGHKYHKLKSILVPLFQHLPLWSYVLYLFIYLFKFYFIFKLYIIALVLPNIKMNPPQAYMCSPSWTLLPPPSPHHPSGSSQCTSPKHLVFYAFEYILLRRDPCTSAGLQHEYNIPAFCPILAVPLSWVWAPSKKQEVPWHVSKLCTSQILGDLAWISP